MSAQLTLPAFCGEKSSASSSCLSAHPPHHPSPRRLLLPRCKISRYSASEQADAAVSGGSRDDDDDLSERMGRRATLAMDDGFIPRPLLDVSPPRKRRGPSLKTQLATCCKQASASASTSAQRAPPFAFIGALRQSKPSKFGSRVRAAEFVSSDHMASSAM